MLLLIHRLYHFFRCFAGLKSIFWTKSLFFASVFSLSWSLFCVSSTILSFWLFHLQIKIFFFPIHQVFPDLGHQALFFFIFSSSISLFHQDETSEPDSLFQLPFLFYLGIIFLTFLVSYCLFTTFFPSFLPIFLLNFSHPPILLSFAFNFHPFSDFYFCIQQF